MFYDYAPTYAKWQLDSYFDLSSEQENWVQSQLEHHFKWHRNTELQHYISFLQEVQSRGVDGLTLEEIEEGNQKINDFFLRITNHLMDDSTKFLSTLEPRQVIFLEEELLEMNREREESRPSSKEERIEEQYKELLDSMEEWFGKLSDEQNSQLKKIHVGWYENGQDKNFVRDQLRKKRQQAFILFLKSNPQQDEIYTWLSYWYENWSVPNDQEALKQRKARIQRNMRRILEVGTILTQAQREHAVAELQVWIVRLQSAIPVNHD